MLWRGQCREPGIVATVLTVEAGRLMGKRALAGGSPCSRNCPAEPASGCPGNRSWRYGAACVLAARRSGPSGQRRSIFHFGAKGHGCSGQAVAGQMPTLSGNHGRGLGHMVVLVARIVGRGKAVPPFWC
jgi:hypothetical protein